VSTIINQLENRVREERKEIIQGKKETGSQTVFQPNTLWIAGTVLVLILLILSFSANVANKLQDKSGGISQEMTQLQENLIESEELLASNQEVTQSFHEELVASRGKVKLLEEELIQQRIEIERLKEKIPQPSSIESFYSE